MADDSSDKTRKPAAARGGVFLLRRVDQLCVGVVVGVSLAVAAAWWFYAGGHREQYIDVDRAARRRADFLVDINAAAWPELSQLPGVGETLARRIVESRERDGPFHSHEDLRRVTGIGPKTLEEMRPYLLPLAGPENVAGR
jgi:competence protein ComEA